MPQDMRINVDAIGWEVQNPVQGQPPVYRSYVRGEVVAVPDHVLEQKRVGTPEVEKVLVHYPPAPGEAMPRARWEPVLVPVDDVNDEVATAAAVRAEIHELEERLSTLRAQSPPVAAPLPPAGGLGPRPVVLTPTTTGVRLVASPEEAAADPLIAAAARLTGPVGDQWPPAEEPPRLPHEGAPTPEAWGAAPAMPGGPNPLPSGPEAVRQGQAQATTQQGEAARRGGVQAPPAPDPSAETSGQRGLPSDLAGSSAQDLARLLEGNPDLADAVEAAEQRRSEPRVTVLKAVSEARNRTAGEGGEGA